LTNIVRILRRFANFGKRKSSQVRGVFTVLIYHGANVEITSPHYGGRTWRWLVECWERRGWGVRAPHQPARTGHQTPETNHIYCGAGAMFCLR
jgi:hypothetical protein